MLSFSKSSDFYGGWVVGGVGLGIIESLLDVDPDPHGQIRIRIQEVKSSEIKLKIAATYNSENKIQPTDNNNSKNSLYFLHFFLHFLSIIRHFLKK